MTEKISMLVASANDACRKGGSTRDFEPALAHLLDAINAAPECRDEVAGWICDGLRARSVEWELVTYLMFELRWPEVKQVVEERLREERDWRSKNVMAHILEAFDDRWDGVDMYRRWSR